MHPLSAEPARPLPRRRTWAAGIGWVLLIPVLLLLGLRLAGLPVGTPWVQLLSLTPLLIVPALVALAFFVLARRRIPAFLAGGSATLLAVLLIAPFAPATHAKGPAGQDCAASGVRLMSLNARLGRADAQAIVDTVKAERVQLLVIQEFTAALGERLRYAGLAQALPHTVQVPDGGAAGARTFAQFPLKTREVPRLESMSFGNPTASFTVFGSDGRDRLVEVTNVHTFPPLPDAVDSWRHDVGALAHVNSEGGTRILAGDFNATYDHREFRDLLRANPAAPLVDASTGGLARLQPTWPRENRHSPGIVIDHVLTSADVSTCGYQTLPIPGSDHAAVLVTLNF